MESESGSSFAIASQPLGKVKFFQNVCTCICPAIRKYVTGGHNLPPVRVNRVKRKIGPGTKGGLILFCAVTQSFAKSALFLFYLDD